MKRKGRKSAAQTPAPAKERIYGSKKNPSGSAASKSSASKIKLSSSIIQTLKDKAAKYNKTHKKDVSTSTLSAVMRRGMGAYSKSHRPTITGGAPNSRQAWGFARVNKFLKKKSGEPVKKAYVQDDDLLENGGEIENYLKNVRIEPSDSGRLYRANFGESGGISWEITESYFDKDASNYGKDPNNPKSVIVQTIDSNRSGSKGEGAKAIASLFLRYTNLKEILYDDYSDGFWQRIGGKDDVLKREDFFKYFNTKFNLELFDDGGEIKGIVKAKTITYTIDDFKHDIELSERWLTDWQRERWVREGQSEEQIERDIKLAKKEISLLTSRTPFTTWFLDIPKGQYKFEIAGATYEIKKDVRKVDVEFGWKRYKQNKNFWYVVKTNDVQTPFDKYIVPFMEIYLSKTREYDSKERMIDGINRYFKNLIREDISEYPLPKNHDIRYKDGGQLSLGAVYSGSKVKTYLNKAEFKDQSFFQFINNGDKYILKSLTIKDLVSRDSTLQSFLKSDEAKYEKNTDEFSLINNYPIVVGDTDYGKNIVLDGYHRIAQAIANGQSKINAFVKISSSYNDGAELPVGKLAKGMSLSEVAAKHNLTADDLKSELVLGVETEKEHTDNPEIARAIALDHLFEDPKYYTKLKQMEGMDSHLSEISSKYAGGGSITPIFQFNTPTGEKSSLTYLQQVLVRTKAFKSFFGDWEAAAKAFIADKRENFAKHFAGVSLVLDYKTFEPKAVYHGTRSESEFFRFDVNKDKGVGRPYGYFAHNKEYSQNFTTSSQRSARNSKPYLYEVFLDVRKPFYANTDSFILKNKDANGWKATIASAIAIQKYSPNKPSVEETMEIDMAVDSQIGKYIESVYKNGNAPFWRLMASDVDKDFKYFLMSYGFDGIFYGEEFQSGFDPDDPAQYTRAVTIFDSKQVKLADGRNLNFDALIDDIRYEEGGDIEAEPVEENSIHIPMNKKMKLGALLFGETYAEGGEVIDDKGNKTNDGKKGGYFKGRSHAEGGIKAINVDTGQLIEVEGNEVIITKSAVADNTKREFEGEMLTNREILSRINQSGGGVSFEEGGELKEGNHTCGCSGKKYNYGGELLEDFNIITKLNEPYDSTQARVKKARAFVDDLIFKMQ